MAARREQILQGGEQNSLLFHGLGPMGMDIYSNYRERTRVLETLFISFTRGKRQEARRGTRGELVEGKNLGV